MTVDSPEGSEVRVSAVIHFLNAAQYLHHSVASVLRQTFPDWELVLVDGGSTDGSTEISRELEERYRGKVRAFRHDGSSPLGIFSSRIWGAREARAPLLALLDADDEWHPQFMERHYAIYRQVFGTGAGMVFCPSVYWWEEPELADRSYVQPAPSPGLHEPPELALEFIEQDYATSPCNSGVMIDRGIVLEADHLIGTADEGVTEDQYLWSHAALNHPIYVSPEPLVRYRQWPGSTCARAAATGEEERAGESHRAWFVDYLERSYEGPQREWMANAVRARLGARGRLSGSRAVRILSRLRRR